MKKIIIALLLIFALMISVTACGKPNGGGELPGGENEENGDPSGDKTDEIDPNEVIEEVNQLLTADAPQKITESMSINVSGIIDGDAYKSVGNETSTTYFDGKNYMVEFEQTRTHTFGLGTPLESYINTDHSYTAYYIKTAAGYDIYMEYQGMNTLAQITDEQWALEQNVFLDFASLLASAPMYDLTVDETDGDVVFTINTDLGFSSSTQTTRITPDNTIEVLMEMDMSINIPEYMSSSSHTESKTVCEVTNISEITPPANWDYDNDVEVNSDEFYYLLGELDDITSDLLEEAE